MITNHLLADVVAAIHALYVAFVVLGLLAILAGVVFRWSWVRNFWFRLIHLLMIAVVVVEAVLGITCPLTTWERQLRTSAGGEVPARSFIGRIAHDLLFLDLPQWMFPMLHCLFGVVVLAVFLAAPPHLPGRQPPASK